MVPYLFPTHSYPCRSNTLAASNPESTPLRAQCLAIWQAVAEVAIPAAVEDAPTARSRMGRSGRHPTLFGISTLLPTAVGSVTHGSGPTAAWCRCVRSTATSSTSVTEEAPPVRGAPPWHGHRRCCCHRRRGRRRSWTRWTASQPHSSRFHRRRQSALDHQRGDPAQQGA